MGKVAVAAATVEMTKPKKKKGRPPKNRPSTPPNSINYNHTPSTNRRSARRNPKKPNSPPSRPEFDDERDEKKVKLVVCLPDPEEQANTDRLRQNRQHSRGYDSGSGSDSDPESEDSDANAKKRRINSIDQGSDDGVSVQEQEETKVTDSHVHVSPLENGPTTPLPDKKLFFILDRLQKKDTYGVFSEAVDPDELPDYFEIIDLPMDFGTVRKKLDSGDYRNLEELEADIFLICSNAMQYNAPDTIYYRQARSIQELAKRDFQNLRNEGEGGEPQPKVVRRGRPPGSKMLKKSLETSPINTAATPSVVPERSSGANLANVVVKPAIIESNSSYNLRKTPMPSRFRSADHFVSSYHSDWSTNWNDEFPAKILRADMKYGSKHFMMDENRRHTYEQFPNSYSGGNYPLLSDFIGAKRLVMVGLQEPLAYARSLARYAATIGPVAWKIASNKIQASVPAHVQYGPGWVGDNGMPSQQSSFSNEKQKSSNSSTVLCNSAQVLTPSICDPNSAVLFGPSEGMVEAVRKLNSQNDQKPVFQPQTSSLMQQRYSLSDPPDLNVRVHVGSPSSSNLQIGSQQQQPDLVLQL